MAQALPVFVSRPSRVRVPLAGGRGCPDVTVRYLLRLTERGRLRARRTRGIIEGRGQGGKGSGAANGRGNAAPWPSHGDGQAGSRRRIRGDGLAGMPGSRPARPWEPSPAPLTG